MQWRIKGQLPCEHRTPAQLLLVLFVRVIRILPIRDHSSGRSGQHHVLIFIIRRKFTIPDLGGLASAKKVFALVIKLEVKNGETVSPTMTWGQRKEPLSTLLGHQHPSVHHFSSEMLPREPRLRDGSLSNIRKPLGMMKSAKTVKRNAYMPGSRSEQQIVMRHPQSSTFVESVESQLGTG